MVMINVVRVTKKNCSTVNMMLVRLTLCFALLVNFSNAESDLTLTRYKDSTSLSTGPNEFAIRTRESLWYKNWRSIDVSGNWASYFSWSCVPIVVAFNELPEEERELFKQAYYKAYGDDIFLPGQNLVQPEIYKFKNGNLQLSSLSGAENFIFYEISGFSVFMIDELSYLVTAANMPYDLAYIWIGQYYVGLVKRSGKILFAPENCQEIELMDYVENMRKTIEEQIRADRWLLSNSREAFYLFTYGLKENVRLKLLDIDKSLQEDHLNIELDELLAQQ